MRLRSSTNLTVNSTARTDLTVFHRALPHYAAYKLLPLIGDEQGSQSQLQKFMGYVARFVQQMRPKGGMSVQMQTNYLQRARMGRRGGSWDRRSLVPPSQWS